MYNKILPMNRDLLNEIFSETDILTKSKSSEDLSNLLLDSMDFDNFEEEVQILPKRQILMRKKY